MRSETGVAILTVGIIFLALIVMLALHRKIVKHFHVVQVQAAQFVIANATCQQPVLVINARQNGEFSFVCPDTKIEHTVRLADKGSK